MVSLFFLAFFSLSMMFEAFGFSRSAPCIAENYLSYLRRRCFGGDRRLSDLFSFYPSFLFENVVLIPPFRLR